MLVAKTDRVDPTTRRRDGGEVRRLLALKLLATPHRALPAFLKYLVTVSVDTEIHSVVPTFIEKNKGGLWTVALRASTIAGQWLVTPGQRLASSLQIGFQ